MVPELYGRLSSANRDAILLSDESVDHRARRLSSNNKYRAAILLVFVFDWSDAFFICTWLTLIYLGRGWFIENM